MRCSFRSFALSLLALLLLAGLPLRAAVAESVAGVWDVSIKAKTAPEKQFRKFLKQQQAPVKEFTSTNKNSGSYTFNADQSFTTSGGATGSWVQTNDQILMTFDSASRVPTFQQALDRLPFTTPVHAGGITQTINLKLRHGKINGKLGGSIQMSVPAQSLTGLALVFSGTLAGKRGAAL